MSRRFETKSVLITGGLGGIGRACAEGFAREGAKLVLADLRIESAAAAITELMALGASEVRVEACDVSREADVVRVCRVAKDVFGGLDVLVNVAGMMIYKPIDELSLDDWTRLMGVNFFGAAMFTREAFRVMQPGSAIVNVSSIHTHQTSPLVAPYAAAKAALGSLTRTASIEGKPKGIRVNAVLPGAVDTPMLWASPNLKSGAETLEPGDVGQPSEIADAVLYLASPQASFVTGASLTVDGGRLAKL
ncbi:MAG: SDR family NAD(P)-dependent oxidoreductase [Asticcacaulis sp.]|uniref:SDR family NAD(P)-dependent oxidoreductase n=1 Tax=Asticcacaulis sp. TaxID=1872648 RepID=UPI003F7BEFDC